MIDDSRWWVVFVVFFCHSDNGGITLYVASFISMTKTENINNLTSISR